MASGRWPIAARTAGAPGTAGAAMVRNTYGPIRNIEAGGELSARPAGSTPPAQVGRRPGALLRPGVDRQTRARCGPGSELTLAFPAAGDRAVEFQALAAARLDPSPASTRLTAARPWRRTGP